MFSKKFLSSVAAATILLTPIANASSQVKETKASMVEMEMREIKKQASINLAQQEALNLLVYSTLLSNEVGAISEVPQVIKKRYETAAKAFFASPSIIAAGYGTMALSAESLEELVSVLEPITALFRVMAKYANMSADFSSEVLERLIPEWVLESSAKSVESLGNLIQAIIRPLVQAGVAYSVGTSVVAGSLYSSVFVTINTAEEAMTYDQVRAIIGYDKELGYKIDIVTAQLAQVFTLTPEKEAKFKEDLRNAIIDEGIKTDFDITKMNVNTLDVLKAQLSDAEIKVLTTIEALYKATENKSSSAEAQTLEKDVTKILAISAVLETILETKNLTRKQRAEVSLRLANAKNVIKQIERNMR